jgi:hypothetical protein
MYACRVVLDSVAPSGGRLTTFEVTFPRIVLAEFNTHRIFSRNSASSRAIPVEKMVKKVEEDCFTPVYWGKNQKGMQAEEEFPPERGVLLDKTWKAFGLQAIANAKRLLEVGVHKQITNRLLEPFLWHTVIVSSTEWDNFYGLRHNPMAQPEIERAAALMEEAHSKSKPQELAPGQWHLPLVTGVDEHTLAKDFDIANLVKISSSRCARVSYLTHDGKRDPVEDLAMFDRLRGPGHMSPFEHPAQALSKSEWKRIAEQMAEKWYNDRVPMGNFWGWLQFRKTITGEHNFRALTGKA